MEKEIKNNKLLGNKNIFFVHREYLKSVIIDYKII